MPEKQKKKKKQLELKGHGTLIWVCMIVFSSAWMFVLGVFVGRGTAPVHFDIEKLQKELIALKETVIKEEQRRFKVYTEAAAKKNLRFYEALKEPKPEAELRPRIPEQTAQISEEDISQEETVSRRQVARPGPERPATKTPGTDASVPRPPEATQGKLSIQVASLKEAEAADRLVAGLKEKGFAARRTVGKVPGKGIWHRVRVGRFATGEDAKSTLEQLKKEGLDAFVVRW